MAWQCATKIPMVRDYENIRTVFLCHSVFTLPFITLATHVQFPSITVCCKIDMQPTPFWLKQL